MRDVFILLLNTTLAAPGVGAPGVHLPPPPPPPKSPQAKVECTIYVKILYQIASKCNDHRPYFHISGGRLAYFKPPLIKSKRILLISLQFQLSF